MYSQINLPANCKVLKAWRSYKAGDEFEIRTKKELDTCCVLADQGIFEVAGYTVVETITRPEPKDSEAKTKRKSKSRKVKQAEPIPPEGADDVEA